MKTKTFSLAIAFSILTTPVHALDWELGDGWKAFFQGFIATDFDIDEKNMGGSEPLLPPRDGTAAADDGTTRFSASQSRIGFGTHGDLYEGVTAKAYIEGDFLDEKVAGNNRGNTTEFRIRHAFWELGFNGGNTKVMVGQYHTVFGDILPELTFDNMNLTLGSLYGREPQARITQVVPLGAGNDITFTGSINTPNSGLFNEATDTAEITQTPFLHGKVAFHTDALGKASYWEFMGGPQVPLELGISGFWGREEVQDEDFNAWGIAFDGIIPIIGIGEDGNRAGTASLVALAWLGENLDSYFGGNGQGIIETSGGRMDEVEAAGFYTTLEAFITNEVWITANYGYEENDTEDLVDSGTPFRIASGLFTGMDFGMPGVGNAQSLNVTVWTNPVDNLNVGVGWDYRKAEYNDGVDGDNNRLNISTFFTF